MAEFVDTSDKTAAAPTDKFGRLERVELRQGWQSEPFDKADRERPHLSLVEKAGQMHRLFKPLIADLPRQGRASEDEQADLR